MDLDNPVIRLCTEGARAEFEGRADAARAFYEQAWTAARDDYEACVAAHYVARFQTTPQAALEWNQEALTRANAVGDERVRDFFPSLYVNLGRAHEQLGHDAEASQYYQLAADLGLVHQAEAVKKDDLPLCDIRAGTAEDAALITNLLKSMVAEMALYGGHPVNPAPDVWAAMVDQVSVNSRRRDHLYLIARDAAQTIVGLAAANLERPEPIFAARPSLHLSAIYTIPSARRQGIARTMIRKILEWGQQMGVAEADLNVLAANPARRLYEQFGFQPREISMVRPLCEERLCHA